MLKDISGSVDLEIFLRIPLQLKSLGKIRGFSGKQRPERKKEIRKTNLFLVGAEGVEPPTLCL